MNQNDLLSLPEPPALSPVDETTPAASCDEMRQWEKSRSLGDQRPSESSSSGPALSQDRLRQPSGLLECPAGHVGGEQAVDPSAGDPGRGTGCETGSAFLQVGLLDTPSRGCYLMYASGSVCVL